MAVFRCNNKEITCDLSNTVFVLNEQMKDSVKIDLYLTCDNQELNQNIQERFPNMDYYLGVDAFTGSALYVNLTLYVDDKKDAYWELDEMTVAEFNNIRRYLRNFCPNLLWPTLQEQRKMDVDDFFRMVDLSWMRTKNQDLLDNVLISEEEIYKGRAFVRDLTEYIDWLNRYIYHSLVSAPVNSADLLYKWVVFRQKGMTPLLHGKIEKIDPSGLCHIKCKNGGRRFCLVDNLLQICSSKQECYSYKE